MAGFAIVFLGAGIGGALRHGVNLASMRAFGEEAFPWGTLIVNVFGSLLMGLIAGYFLVRTGVPQNVRLFLTTGILGGFTTFSAFSLDTALLMERHQYGLAAAYATGSVILSVTALFAGLAIFSSKGIIP